MVIAKRGQPKVESGENVVPTTFSLPWSMRIALDRAAEALGMGRSKFLRKLITEKLKEMDGNLGHAGRTLKNPATGSVASEREWFEQYKRSSPEEWGGYTFESAGLVEVVPNIEGEAGYDPSCGDWRKA